MKKSLKRVIFIIINVFILSPICVLGYTNPVIDYQAGIYSNRVSNGITYYGQLGYIYVNNKIAYCVEPLDIIGSNYEEVNKLNNLTENQIMYFELVNHFGYNTTNHNSVYYYMAAQELIWENIYGISNVYWTTSSGTNGDLINIDYYKNEINNSAGLSHILPMFNDTAIIGDVGKTYQIIDNNDMLKYYHISSTGNNEAWIQNNSLFVKINDYNIGNIVLAREEHDYFKTKFFTSNSGQDLGQFGLDYEINKSITVLPNKYTSLVGINVKSGLRNVKGKTTFKIYNMDTSSFVNYENSEVFETDDNGSFVSRFKLNEGNYKIINADLPYGYIYGNDITFEINKNNQLNNNVYYVDDNIVFATGNLKINTFYQIGNEDIKLNNLIYKIYASEDINKEGTVLFEKNSLVDISNTGNIGSSLSQGKYYVMVYDENNLLLSNNHYEVSINYVDSYTDINKTLDINLDYNLYNVNLNVKEKLNNELNNLSNMQYDIYADQDIYLGGTLIYKQFSYVGSLITDINGNANYSLLNGEYCLREVSVIDKYYITNDQLFGIYNNDLNVNVVKLLKESKKEDIKEVVNEVKTVTANESDKSIEELPNTNNYNLKYYLIFASSIILGLIGIINEKKN